MTNKHLAARQGNLGLGGTAESAICSHLKVAAELVDHKSGKGLLLDVLSHHHDGVAAADGLLKDVDHVTGSRDLLVNKEQAAVLVLAHLKGTARPPRLGMTQFPACAAADPTKNCLAQLRRSCTHHALGVGDKVRGDVSALELHALDHVEAVLGSAALLHGDDTRAANLGHGVSNQLSDLHVATGRHGGDIDEVAVRDLGGELSKLRNEVVHGLLNAAGELHGVGSCRDDLHTLCIRDINARKEPVNDIPEDKRQK